MPRCLLALGANLGNREETLRNALRELAALPHTRLLARSTWHETPAVGGPEAQPSFFNGALLLDTLLEPQVLADGLHEIEVHLGRERKVRWAARTLDIDLLLYGERTIDTPQLTVPHPRMTFRHFVLAPAAEIAGQLVVPPGGWTIAALLRHLQTAARYVAILASDPRLADELASQLCRTLNAPRLEDFFPLTTETDDTHLLSAADWAQHKELLKRLPQKVRESNRTLAPIIGCYRDSVGKLTYLTDLVQPALVIAVEPPPSDFCEILRRPGLGPVARITATSPEAILDEALAAIAAAWAD